MECKEDFVVAPNRSLPCISSLCYAMRLKEWPIVV